MLLRLHIVTTRDRHGFRDAPSWEKWLCPYARRSVWRCGRCGDRNRHRVTLRIAYTLTCTECVRVLRPFGFWHECWVFIRWKRRDSDRLLTSLFA